MSHFTVLCIFPTKPDNLESAVGEALSSYDENVEVPRYRDACWCVGLAAEQHVRETYTNSAYEKARAKFKAPKYDEEKCGALFAPKHVQRAWHDFVEPIEKKSEALRKKHKLYKKPDPTCEDCKGTGRVWSTRNPQSKWDWYVIGGRWDGKLNSKNEAPLSSMIDEISNKKDESGKVDNFTFALCIDGDWYEAGKMLMFASVSGEDYDFGKKYIKLCKSYLKTNPDAYCALVDCHI